MEVRAAMPAIESHSMEPVRFGVVGAGSAWSFHSAGCLGSSALKFVSVYDINEAQASRVAASHRVNEMKAYADLQEFLHSEIDAVLVMVRTPITKKLCSAPPRKHVLRKTQRRRPRGPRPDDRDPGCGRS
jgi:predicted dehydrogenase